MGFWIGLLVGLPAGALVMAFVFGLCMMGKDNGEGMQ